MCLVCVFLMIKKADNVLNNNFLIRFLSLLYSFSPVFSFPSEQKTAFSSSLFLFSSVFSFPSEQKTKKPNPRTSSSPSTPKKIHGWALRSSELSADQHLQPEITQLRSPIFRRSSSLCFFFFFFFISFPFLSFFL